MLKQLIIALLGFGVAHAQSPNVLYLITTNNAACLARSSRKIMWKIPAIIVLTMLLAAWTHGGGSGGSGPSCANPLTDPSNGNYLLNPANGNFLCAP